MREKEREMQSDMAFFFKEEKHFGFFSFKVYFSLSLYFFKRTLSFYVVRWLKPFAYNSETNTKQKERKIDDKQTNTHNVTAAF